MPAFPPTPINPVHASGYLPLALGTAAQGASELPAMTDHVHPVRFALSVGGANAPVANGDVTLELTSNTQLTLKAKGNDGTVRAVTLTLA